MKDLESIIHAENLRAKGKITIRTGDTNIWMSRPDSFYILTGNFEEIKDSETELAGFTINGDPIDPRNKEPHDLVLITHTIDELDSLTHSDNPEKRHKAINALREIEKLFTSYGSPERDIDYTKGQKHITLPNGARVYCYSGPFGLKGIAYRLLNRLHVISTDKLIQVSFMEFLSKHPEYKRAVQISQDVGYRVNALLSGSKADNSRFDKVKNPRQINTGLAYCTITDESLQLVKDCLLYTSPSPRDS